MSSSPTDQLVRVEMPQMGVSVAEGTIVEWRKRTGDWVEADEPICDITTDKIDVEVPSPSSGRVERILVEPGETVSVGTPLAEINPGAKPGEAHPEEDVNGARTQGTGAPADEQAGAPAAPPPAHDGEPDRSGFHSPVVRRIADKHGIDLSQVTGTGIGGRVRKRDVLAFIESREAGPAEPKPEPTLHMESPYRPEEPEQPPAPQPDGAGGGLLAGAPRADVADAAADRASHGREPPHLGPLHDDRRSGHVRGGPAQEASSRRTSSVAECR